jgi:hypothetical protein
MTIRLVPTAPVPALTCGTCYGSGENDGRDCTSCSIRPNRCTSCDHLASFHQPDGCWHSVTVGTLDRDLGCPCTAAPPARHTRRTPCPRDVPSAGGEAEQ